MIAVRYFCLLNPKEHNTLTGISAYHSLLCVISEYLQQNLNRRTAVEWRLIIMLGEIKQLSANLWYIQGEMPDNSSKAPDPCNVVIYKAESRLYLLDSSSGLRMRESIKKVLLQAGPAESFTLVNTHNHLDHICNNDFIDLIEAKFKHHYLLKAGISSSTLDAPAYFAEQFDKMDEYYDPFTSYQTHRMKYRFAAFIRDVAGLFAGRKRVLKIFFTRLFAKFEPVNISRSSMEPLENLPVQQLRFKETEWSGWSLGTDDIYVLEGRAHTDDEIFVYIPEHRLLFLGDVTFPLFPTWDNSSRDRILKCLQKSLTMVKSGMVDILADGHSNQCFMTKDGIVAMLETTIADHLEYENILQDIFQKEDGLTPGEAYERFKKYDGHPVVKKYLQMEYPHSPPSLQNVIVTTLLQMGYKARGKHRHKRFYL